MNDNKAPDYYRVKLAILGERGHPLIYVDERGVVAKRSRASASFAVSIAVHLLGLDPSVNQQATDAYPAEFVICGPLTLAEYRARSGADSVSPPTVASSGSQVTE